MTTILISKPRETTIEAITELGRQVCEKLSAAASIDADLCLVPHLYDLEETGEIVGAIRQISTDGPVIVFAAMFPRAVRWTLQSFGAAVGNPDLHCFDLREIDITNPAAAAETIVDAITNVPGIVAADGSAPRPDGVCSMQMLIDDSTPARWYPVIDNERCSGCLECLNFCLFGVYGLDENSRPIVEQPDACRDGCPACSRICPAQAIIFPMYSDSMIAGRLAPEPASSPTAAPADAKPEAQQSQADEERRNALDRLVDDIDDMDL